MLRRLCGVVVNVGILLLFFLFFTGGPICLQPEIYSRPPPLVAGSSEAPARCGQNAAGQGRAREAAGDGAGLDCLLRKNDAYTYLGLCFGRDSGPMAEGSSSLRVCCCSRAIVLVVCFFLI